ncbi:MAG: TSUP family transporter [Alphaproteobacteria bacterium]|nr:TSUP family transporter [Alphaproteobacteria bacterium]
MLLVLAAGLVAGVLTTVAGSAGGMLVTLTLLAVTDPATALTISGPALLLGNLHRLTLYRDVVDRPLAARYALGGGVGAVLGGVVVSGLPAHAVHGVAAGLAVLAAVRVLARLHWTAPSWGLLPGGALVGLASATSGGGGLLAGPLLMSTGLTGRAYVATAAAGAIVIHLARLVAYGATGWLRVDALGQGVVLAGVLAVGNLLGDRVRVWVPEAVVPRVEVGVSLGAVGLALAGLAG